MLQIIGAESCGNNDYDYANLDCDELRTEIPLNRNPIPDLIENPYYGDVDDAPYLYSHEQANNHRNELEFETITATRNLYYE